jgi:hypothetical protein
MEGSGMMPAMLHMSIMIRSYSIAFPQQTPKLPSITQPNGLLTKMEKWTSMLYAGGASEVMLSNSADFSNSTWEPFVEVKKAWQLNIGKTEAVIYAKF